MSNLVSNPSNPTEICSRETGKHTTVKELGPEAAVGESPFFISIVIVNFNGAGLLERCLASVMVSSFRDFEVVLVDNASTDGSVVLVREKFPQVRVVESETNVGFAAGNNLGIGAARGNLIATLNTDTRVEADYLARLVAPMVDAKVGACAPLMLEMERPNVVDAAGIRVDVFGFAWNVGVGDERRKTEDERTVEVYGACAGAALYRRAMLDQVGSFDDRYFGFYEDADLAWRAHDAGWKTMFVAAARVYHQHGASFGRMSPRKTFLLARNRWWTVLKNYERGRLLLLLPFILVLDFASLMQAAARGHFGEAWRGRMEGWRGKG